MKRFIRQSLGFVLLLAGLVLTASLVLFLILWSLLGTDVPAIQRLLCKHDLTEACAIEAAEAEAAAVRAEMEDLLAQMRKKEAEFQDLGRRRAELQELYDRLERLENATESYVIFSHDRGGVYPVVTGWQYASLLEPNRLTKGWCYFDVVQGSDNDKRTVYLAEFGSGLRLTANPVNSSTLRDLGLSETGLSSLRARCKWPEGVS